MEIKRVGILRGGTGENYSSSLRKGGDIIFHIHENLSDKYKVVDILIDKNGVWHVSGMPIDPMDLIYKIDVIWNTSQHPDLSAILNNLSIPNIENSSFLKVLENDKDIFQSHIKSMGIKIPRSIILSLYQEDFDGRVDQYIIKKAKEIHEKMSPPWIVKSYTTDSNMGIHLAKTFRELVEAIEDGVIHKKSILIEEFILGKVASVHSITGFRGEDVYVLPSENFTTSEKEKVSTLVKDLHTRLGVNHYLKSNFTLHPRQGFFLTGVEFSPDLRKDSHFHQICESVGAKAHSIVEHMLNTALN